MDNSLLAELTIASDLEGEGEPIPLSNHIVAWIERHFEVEEE